MPSDVVRYTVFLSCPTDMNSEYQALQAQINRFNNTTWRTDKIFVELLHWSESVTPKSGVTAQDHINETLNEYDIYIGVMGARFGSPTNNAGSGTEEEYNIALNKYLEAPDKSHVAFFFKQVEISADANETEWEQLNKVRAFKKKLQTDGVYGSFKTPEEFVNVVIGIILQFIKKQSTAVMVSQQQLALISDIPNESSFAISPLFQNFLQKNDIELTHPHKNEITLNDIFVPVDLTRLNQDKSKDTSYKADEIISSERLLNFNGENFRWVITGTERAGKTSLGKMLYSSFHSKGYIPIWINGKDIKQSSYVKFEKKLKQRFESQYNEKAFTEFEGIYAKKAVFIIDDFHASKMNIKFKTRFLKELSDKVSNIVCIADDVFHIDATTSPDSQYRELVDFEKYEIRDLGHKLRFQLIEKWNTLGREETIEREILDSKNLEIRNLIDSVLGTNFVQSNPFVLLVLLQAYEAGNIRDLSNGSLVRYYEYLIDKQLLRKVNDKDLIEVYYGLLPRLAYKFFCLNSKTITKADLEEVTAEFANQKAISPDDIKLVMSGLVSHQILLEEHGEYRFSQPYLYYYFLTDYLSKNSNIKEIKDKIDHLINHLYVHENAHIIIFLAYHTSDESITKRIIAIADALFVGNQTFEFDKTHNSPINQLVTEGPKLVVDHENSRQIHKKVLIARDQYDLEKIPKEEQVELCENVNDLNFSSKLNLTFKVSQILGQLMKNHHVNFDKEHKIQICDSIYNLMMRCLDEIFAEIANNVDYLSAELKNINPKIKTETQAGKALFQFVSFMIFIFVTHSSRFVGDKKLKEIYRLMDESTNSCVRKVISFGIKLEFFPSFPVEEMKKIVEETSGNHLATTCMRLLTHRRMYLRPVEDYKLRQSICDHTGLENKPSFISKEKKIG